MAKIVSKLAKTLEKAPGSARYKISILIAVQLYRDKAGKRFIRVGCCLNIIFKNPL